jgi:hypothetical protein
MRNRLGEGLTIRAALLAGFGLTLGLWLFAGYQVTWQPTKYSPPTAANGRAMRQC